MNVEPYFSVSSSKPVTELILMYTWDLNGYYDNKICGHMYELIDYYWILKDYFDIKIIFPTNYDLEMVLSKYAFTLEEKIELSKKLIPRPKSGIIKTKGGKGLVLITDGNLGNFKGIIYGIPVQFSCGKLGLIPKDKRTWYLLHDRRICNVNQFVDYDSNPPKKVFNYNKRILFDKLYKDNSYKPLIIEEHFLFYLTENCKYQTEEQINKILEKYKIKETFSVITIVCDYDFDISKLDYPNSRIQFIDISNYPIDIFSIPFTTYVYTDVKRQWDCSNRLIAECDFQDRKVFFANKYQDNALVIRRFDIVLKNRLSFLQKEDACFMKAENVPYNIELTNRDIIIHYLDEILKIEEQIKREKEDEN